MSFIFPSTACLAALSILIPKLSEAIRTDWRFEVVGEALDCLTDLLKELKGLAFGNAVLKSLHRTLLDCCRLFFTGR
jgi:hypothetical protein